MVRHRLSSYVQNFGFYVVEVSNRSIFLMDGFCEVIISVDHIWLRIKKLVKIYATLSLNVLTVERLVHLAHIWAK